jgi:hypothetical protein
MSHSMPLEAIARIVDYLWRDEELNYDNEPDHIFIQLKVVRKWLDDNEVFERVILP